MQNKTTSFTHNDYEVIKREVLYQGIFRLARYHLRQRRFNGEWSEAYTREVFERQSATAILPYDPILDRVILIEQFRVGAISNPQSPWLLEIVAGICNEGDQPEEMAKQEALEEAGSQILDIYPICGFYASPGGCNEFVNLYCGRVDATEIGGVHGNEYENEDIRAFTISVDEAYQLIQEGKILTPPAIIALQWLLLNREWLKQLWQKK